MGEVIIHAFADGDDDQARSNGEAGVDMELLFTYRGLLPVACAEWAMWSIRTGVRGVWAGIMPVGIYGLLILDYEADGLIPFYGYPGWLYLSTGERVLLWFPFSSYAPYPGATRTPTPTRDACPTCPGRTP